MISSDHLEPGATGRIRATVNTKGRNGRVAKHITVYSNDPAHPMISLGMIMNIVQKKPE